MSDYVSQNNLQQYATESTAKYKTIFATKNEVGSPLVANTAAEMTDTTKIYVYVGSETGYTNGHWYYYNGSAWADGGVYNSTALTTDTTLSIAGMAADAKAAGDAIGLRYGGTINNLNTYTSCDDLPIGYIFVVATIRLENQPISRDGIVYTLSRTNNDTLVKVQYFVDTKGNSYTRILWGTWTDWKKECSDTDLSDLSTSILSQIALQYGGTISDTSTYTSFNDLPVGKIFVISGVSLSESPSSGDGIVYTLAQLNNATLTKVQYFIKSDGFFFNRTFWSTWRAWNQIAIASDVTNISNSIGLKYGGTINDTDTYTSCDDLPIGYIFAVTGITLLNEPTTSDGIVYTLSRAINDSVVRVQYYISTQNIHYCRTLWGTWTSWSQMATTTDISNLDTTLRNIINTEVLNFNLTIGELEDGKYVHSGTGAHASYSGYVATGYIPIVATNITVPVVTWTANVGLAFYDKDKVYISGRDFASDTHLSNVSIDVPQNARFVSICAYSQYSSNIFIRVNKIADALTIQDEDPVVTVNPCLYKDSSECKVFKKILCIGDSLTAGQFDYKVDGVIHEFNDQDYAYPTFLKNITGRDTTNKGDAGETTKSWWEIHQNDDLSGHDACIIMLGRNDYVPGRETTSAERAEAYANIINKVRTENPQIKVFLSTLINYYTGADADLMNQDTRTAASVNNCYLLDISQYGTLVFSTDAYSHCTATGYYKLAEQFFNYISYIIHNNLSQFKNVQFIGTNRSY